jgi:hypothetical protein
LSVLAIFALCDQARAHRLEAEYRVLPGHKIAVESWFDLTGDSPVGAAVTVCRQAGGSLLAEGKLDEKGLFVFTYSQAEPLRIVVTAPGGHRKELEISAEQLSQHGPVEAQTDTPAAASSQTATVDPEQFADRSTRIAVKDVLLGLALLLAAGALGLALSTARRLRDLRRKIEGPQASRQRNETE